MPDTQRRLPDVLYTAEQVRDLDARLIAAGTPGLELMQRAARATWRAVRRRWPEAGVLTVLTGHGNNAGDGYLLAQLAHQAFWKIMVFELGDEGVQLGCVMHGSGSYEEMNGHLTQIRRTKPNGVEYRS